MYKDYYCDLLQNLPHDWEKVTIEELGTIYSGGTPSRDEPSFWNGSIAWVTPGELTTLQGKWITKTREYITESGLLSSSAQLLPKGYLLVTTRATIGYVAIAATGISTNQGFKSLIVNQLAISNFYYHLFKFITPEIKKKSCGSTFPEISRQDFKSILVPQPPLFEQQQIAQILDTIDEAIARTSSLIAKLKQMKAGLLHDLLTRGLDENGELRNAIAHPEQFKDSPLGQIPKDWGVFQLLEILPRAEYGISVSLEDEDGIPVLRMNNLKEGEVDLTDLKKSASPKAANLLLQISDVLFNRTNSIEHVGRTAIWRGQIEQASFASYLVRLIPDQSKLIPEYLNIWLNLETTQLLIRRYATPGVHQVNINPTNLRKVLIGLPQSTFEQEAIVEKIKFHNNRIHQEEAYLEKLKLQKQGLMQDLLTGEVRVNQS